jgi:hypothetical protein
MNNENLICIFSTTSILNIISEISYRNIMNNENLYEFLFMSTILNIYQISWRNAMNKENLICILLHEINTEHNT